MTESTLEHAASDEMYCPACNARQVWSDECRRCKCDLSLLRRYWRTGEAQRRQCLRQLRAGHADQALRHARCYSAIVGVAEASRLLGVCHLLCGDWPKAMSLVVLCDGMRAKTMPG